MEFLDEKTLKIDRVETILDKFVVEFTKMLEKYAKYTIISGYVAILLGRSRATEDVDIFIEKIEKEKFFILFDNLRKNGYNCFNAQGPDDAFNHLLDNLALRFSRKNKPIPNIEIKFAKTDFDKETLENRIKIVMPFGNIFTSEIERQIAFKRFVLKSDKDLEDAEHMEKALKGNINNKKIETYRKILENY